MKGTKELLILVLPLIAAGCNSGATATTSPPPPPPGVDPEGIYAGSVTSNTDKGNSILGIVTADGTASFVEFSGTDITTFPPAAVIVPDNLVTDDNGSFSQSFTAYSDNSFVLPSGTASDSGTFYGTATADQSINGGYTFTASGTTIAYTTAYDQADYEVASSGQAIAGTYSAVFMVGTNTVTANFTITPGQSSDAATIVGGDTSGLGCNFSGSISTPNEMRNAYKIAIVASSCTNPQNDYSLTGLGSYLTINSVPGLVTILSDTTSGVGVVMLLTQIS